MARIAVIPGDGIGTEVAQEGVRTLEALASRHDLKLDFEYFDLGAERYLRDGSSLPEEIFIRLRDEFDAIYFGAVGDPRVPSNQHAKDILLGLRTRLDLYVNLRPCRLYDATLTPLARRSESDIDFVVFRENTEGLYVDVGGTFKRGTAQEVAINEDINTRLGVERIIRAAFNHCVAHNHSSLVMADKANVLTHAHGLWRRVFAELAEEFPQVKTKAMYVDALAMELVRNPQDFEVIVTCNLFGDILTDLGAAICGGLGLAASGNINPGKVSLFEPVHGSAPDIAGKGIANPLAMFLSGALMLEHLGFSEAAKALETATAQVIRNGPRPPDLGGTARTHEVGAAVREAL